MDRVAVAAARHPPDGFAVDPHRYARTEQRLFDEVGTCYERERAFERG